MQVMFSAPKAQFNRAIDRNVLKRRMREAFRYLKPDYQTAINGQPTTIAFIHIESGVSEFELIRASMTMLLGQLDAAVRTG